MPVSERTDASAVAAEGPKHVLGLSAGNPGGSAEILLKEALRGAEAAGARVAMVRISDLDLSVGPNAVRDDADWFWDRLMTCDALVVSSPIYTRTIPGVLRLLGDKISGPQADVAFTAELIRMREEHSTIAVDFAVDERVLRPRVAGFIAVGGSHPSRWKSLALPLMHTLTASAQIAVVDQVVFGGAGSPSSIVLQTAALERARALGTNTAGQAGRTYEQAEYRGEPGLCPVCHLSVIEFHGNRATCATCGASGLLTVADSGPVFVVSESGRAQSVESREEKTAHFAEVQETAARHQGERARIDARSSRYREWNPLITPRDSALGKPYDAGETA